MQRTRGALAGVILALCLAGIAAAADIPAEEADLNPAGEVYEVNPDAAGGLIISDYGANEVWRVAAGGGAYTRYTGLPTPIDARADSAGDIWWVDYDSGSVLGRINVAAGTVTTWDFKDWNPDLEYSLSGLAFDSAGRVWIVEYFGATSRLYRFDPASGQLCAYAIPGGAVSNYVVQRGDVLWMANWFTDRLVRFDPAGNGVTWWQLPAGTVQGIALDAAGDVWLADEDADSLYRLRPGSGELTVYALPAGARPHLVAVAGQAVWYSAGGNGAIGTVGRLDPATAVGDTSTPDSGSQTPGPPTCASLGGGTTAPVASSTGTLAWSASTWTTLADAGGWQVYALPQGANPYGIAAASDHVWAGDQGRQVLSRTPVKVEYRVLLPLIVRG